MEDQEKTNQNKNQSSDKRKISRREALKSLAVVPLIGPALYGNFKSNILSDSSPSYMKKSTKDSLFLEAEQFSHKGGWVIDQQFMDQMGSPYLLAHGLGQPVADASTRVSFPKTGTYHLWVRTKDWAPYPKGPGTFKVHINDNALDTLFGSNGDSNWKWQYGGRVNVRQIVNKVSLQDLTGFEGRCDALFFTQDSSHRPPNNPDKLKKFRRHMLGLPQIPTNAGQFDYVVVGGGRAGTCAAVAAARKGLKVALIHDRPVLGGPNSSEVRVNAGGELNKTHYPKIGSIVKELDVMYGSPDWKRHNAGRNPEAYGDEKKLKVVQSEKNISLYLNMHATDVKVKNGTIQSVIAEDIETNEEFQFTAPLFADCTGDANIGYLAGADYRMGRESKEQTQESYAVDQEDEYTMGSSNLWNAVKTENPTSFPECSWALRFSEEYHIDDKKGDWQWETGFDDFHTIREAEELRDHNFRAVYGNWAFLKNNLPEYKNWKLNWLAYIAGKRESRRLMGDIILDQHDIQNQNMYPDSFIETTWSIDLHFPEPECSKYFDKEFRSICKQPEIEPYPIPFRCLYSRNISNLLMAGRDISVTHVALGTVRVQRTTGMMGEVIGYAAYLCNQYDVTPRGLYNQHLSDFKEMLHNLFS